MPRVTASVVLYNTQVEQLARLLNCIESSDTVQSLFLIDNSPRPMSSVPVMQGRVQYRWTGKNLGYGGGHNVAMREVLDSSDYHFVINPDTYFQPEVLGSLVSFAQLHPEVGQLMPKVVYPDGQLQYLCKLLPTPIDLLFRRLLPEPLKRWTSRRTERYELRFTGYNKVMDVPYLSGCFMLFRASALRKVGLFDERFFMYPEDIDITRRMHTEFRTVFYPGVFIVHEHARASYRNWRMLAVHMLNIIRYFNKWGWIFDSQREQFNEDTLRRLRTGAQGS